MPSSACDCVHRALPSFPTRRSSDLVCSPIPQLIELEWNMIDACVNAGVSHIVLSSAMGAREYRKSFPSWHRRVEDKLKSTKISFTIDRKSTRLNSSHLGISYAVFCM